MNDDGRRIGQSGREAPYANGSNISFFRSPLKTDIGVASETSELLNKCSDDMKRAAGQLRDKSVAVPFSGIEAKLRDLSTAAGRDFAIGRLADRLDAQKRAIGETGESLKKFAKDMDRMVRPLQDVGNIMNLSHNKSGESLKPEAQIITEFMRVPELHIPPSPVLETNRRLERLEERIEQLHDIVTKMARITTELQSVAAEFLEMFERTAVNNARSARRAIGISVAAVVIAVLMTTTQIVYSEFRRGPDIDSEILTALQDAQAELSAMRDSHAVATGRLGEAIVSSDSESAAILREIHTLLSREATPSVSMLEVSNPHFE